MKEFNKASGEQKIDISGLSTREVMAHYFQQKGDYFITDASTFLSELKLPVPLSKQEGVLFLLVTKGQLNVKAGYSDCKVVRGGVLIIQPQKPFSIESFSDDTEGYVLYIKGDGIIGTMGSHSLIFNLDFLETWSQSLYTVESSLIVFIENIFKRIQKEYNSVSNNVTIVNTYVITLLLELNSIYNVMTDGNRAAIELSRRFKTEVFRTLDGQHSIQDYAQRLSVTPNHLNKAVKSVTGDSASSLLNKIKMIESKYLLMMANVTVAEVAAKLGFEDPSYFSRFFKKHEGVTPNEFRKMIELS